MNKLGAIHIKAIMAVEEFSLFHTLMFYFCISICGWHLTVNPALLQSRKKWIQPSAFGIVFAGHAQSLWWGALGSKALACPFASLTIPDDPEHCTSSHMSACLAFVLQRRDEIAAYWHLLWTKGRKSKHLVIWTQVGFQKASPNSVSKPNFSFLFSFNIFHQKKKKGDRWLWKRDLKNNNWLHHIGHPKA